MVMYQKRQQATFFSVHTQGAILPMDLLRRIASLQETQLVGLAPHTYHLTTEKLNEAINRSWNRALSEWRSFRSVFLSAENDGTWFTWERWLLPLFNELGYGRLTAARPILIGEKAYAVSHLWQHTPIHLVSCKTDLDRVARGVEDAARFSPHSLLQELLNRSPDHLWGFVSNGLVLRILRNNVRLTRQAYVEFDLKAMMDGEIYADFALMWLLIHQSRVEAEKPEGCWLEKWSRQTLQEGIRALDRLHHGVQKAIEELGSGFLVHKANAALRSHLQSGTLSAQDYYRQILRLIYRFLILFVIEDRGLLFHPDASQSARERYTKYYSTMRLRKLSDCRIGSRHSDLFQGLNLVMEQLGKEHGYLELDLPALNGFLFSPQALPDLAGCQIANYYLLAAIRWLTFVEAEGIRRAIDFKNLGSEELGSVYESLLEMHPEFNIDGGKFTLVTADGHERKTSGTYYTPPSLVQSLLDSALDPVLDAACAQPEPEKALLALKVCDPACGSGHFLIAAAHRMATRLAAVRTGLEEAGPAELRAALRDVVSQCIYGVDINPLAVELCKVSLWMEALEPGKPFSYMDAHIQCGNSLLGATPALLRKGIPDEAFEPIAGDDRQLCKEYRRHNRLQRPGQLSFLAPDLQLWEQHDQRLHNLSQERDTFESMPQNTVAQVHKKQEEHQRQLRSEAHQQEKLCADAWCAAFVWRKNGEFPYAITEEIFRLIQREPHKLTPWMRAEIERLARQYQFFHWHLAFPEVFRVPRGDEQTENELAGWSGGFDVIVGNTPWERIKIQEKEWFARRKPSIATAPNAAARRKMIAALQNSLIPGERELYAAFMEDQRQATGESHFVRASQHYPLCGRGDINTYAIFAENMRWMVNPSGRVGCIVPSGIATDDTTKWFFREVIETSTLASLYSFENEEFLFPAVHHATKFCLLTLTGLHQLQQAADFVFFARQTQHLQEKDRHFSLSAGDIALLNPNTHTCPIFRSKRDMELTKAIYQRVPVLIEEQEGMTDVNPWQLSFKRMFDMANDSGLFRTREQLTREGWTLSGNVFRKGTEQYLPLYEGKMIWHFDHRFGTYVGQTQAQANQGKLPELSEEQHADPFLSAMPRYWIHEIHTPDIIHDVRAGFPVFRDVTNAGVLRTAIFSIIPHALCGDTAHAVILDYKDTQEALYLTSCGASFVFDYAARQKLGGSHLKYFVIKQLPMLSPHLFKLKCSWHPTLTLGDWIAPRALELTYTAWDLAAFAKDCGYDGPPFRWDEERRFLLRCELDAAYFHLYGIARDDVDYIMDTFRVWREKEEKQQGEYRTKRVILEIYDEMQRAIASGVAYRTRLEPGPADQTVAHATHKPPLVEPGDIEDAGPARQVS